MWFLKNATSSVNHNHGESKKNNTFYIAINVSSLYWKAPNRFKRKRNRRSGCLCLSSSTLAVGSCNSGDASTFSVDVCIHRARISFDSQRPIS
jgi:hypothetical protein